MIDLYMRFSTRTSSNHNKILGSSFDSNEYLKNHESIIRQFLSLNNLYDEDLDDIKFKSKMYYKISPIKYIKPIELIKPHINNRITKSTRHYNFRRR